MSVKKASFVPHLLGVSVAIASSAAVAGPSFEIGERTTIDTALTVNYTASVRTGKQAKQYLESLNNDDGTRNFDRGSLITNRVSLFGEVLVRHDNLGQCCVAATSTMRPITGATTTIPRYCEQRRAQRRLHERHPARQRRPCAPARCLCIRQLRRS